MKEIRDLEERIHCRLGFLCALFLALGLGLVVWL